MHSADTFMPGAHFHVLTPLYERLAQPLLAGVWRQTAAEVVERAPKNGKVVDIGCGPGTVLRLIRERRDDLTLEGIDVDPRMIAMAESRSIDKNITYHRASADALPVANGTADIVLSTLVFHHLPLRIKQGAFAEIRRILKPNGEFLLCDFSRQKLSVSRSIMRELQMKFFLLFEPEAKPQLEGQIFDLAKEQHAIINVLWFRRFQLGMHSIHFPDAS